MPTGETGEGPAGCDTAGEARVPLVAAALPKRLGSFPFWRGKEEFIAAMEAIYQQASAAGLQVFVGEKSEK